MKNPAEHRYGLSSPSLTLMIRILPASSKMTFILGSQLLAISCSSRADSQCGSQYYFVQNR
jgi:hypothetical protein